MPQGFPPMLSNHKPWRLHHEQVFPGRLAGCLNCCTYKDIRCPDSGGARIFTPVPSVPPPPTYLTRGSVRSATSLIGRISRSPESPQAEYSWPRDPGEVVWSMGNELQAGYAQGSRLAGTAYHDGQSVATEDCNGPWLRHWAPWSLLLMK